MHTDSRGNWFGSQYIIFSVRESMAYLLVLYPSLSPDLVNHQN